VRGSKAFRRSVSVFGLVWDLGVYLLTVADGELFFVSPYAKVGSNTHPVQAYFCLLCCEGMCIYKIDVCDLCCENRSTTLRD
jgi:hypothetical protein